MSKGSKKNKSFMNQKTTQAVVLPSLSMNKTSQDSSTISGMGKMKKRRGIPNTRIPKEPHVDTRKLGHRGSNKINNQN